MASQIHANGSAFCQEYRFHSNFRVLYSILPLPMSLVLNKLGCLVPKWAGQTCRGGFAGRDFESAICRTGWPIVAPVHNDIATRSIARRHHDEAWSSTAHTLRMMSTERGVTEQQATFTRQATILRKNLQIFDGMLHNQRGEDWPSMMGRLNASFHQATNMDRNIEDVLEHFVYVPKKSTANAQDIPFFLSTRLESAAPTTILDEESDAVATLARFEKNCARIATECEEKIVRF